MARPGNAMNVQSIERALAILRYVAGTEAGVSQIAGAVGLPKSTVSRLLATLHDNGAVSLSAGRFSIGPLIGQLAAGTGRHGELVAIARPYLVGLVDAFGEDAGVSVLDGGDVLYLDQLSSDAAVQLRDWTGERVPPHCVSSGLVLLAHASPDARQRALEGPLPRLTARTMVAPTRLRRRLVAVARGATANGCTASSPTTSTPSPRPCSTTVKSSPPSTSTVRRIASPATATRTRSLPASPRRRNR